MKKICLLFISLFVVFNLYAQDRPQEGGKDFKPIRTPMSVATRYGITAGANMAKFHLDNMEGLKTQSHTSFYAGAFVNVPIGGMLRIQPGIVYSGQGSDLTDTTGGASVDFEQSLHYINVPIMFQVQTKMGFFLETGPQAGFLVAARTKLLAPGATVEEDNKDDFDMFDLSWGVGLGYLTRIGVGINARYNFGITNTLDENTKDGPEAKNRVIQVGLVYHIGAHK